MRTYEAKEKKLVEARLVKKLKNLGVFNCKGNPKQLKGFPDRIIFINKHIIFVECKAGKELGSYYQQTPLQKKWQKQITASDGEYWLVVGAQEVDVFIEWLKEKIKTNGKTYCF